MTEFTILLPQPPKQWEFLAGLTRSGVNTSYLHHLVGDWNGECQKLKRIHSSQICHDWGFKLRNKLIDKKEHNKSGWGGEPDRIPQEAAGSGPHVPTAPKGCAVWKKPSRRLQDSVAVCNSVESRAEPWVLPLSFPLGRGGLQQLKKKIFLVMSRCEGGKS